jgi:hypothetical protein
VIFKTAKAPANVAPVLPDRAEEVIEYGCMSLIALLGNGGGHAV